jgi:anti-anti-sigma factor
VSDDTFAAPPPEFAVSVSQASDGRAIVAASGELDIASAPQLLNAIAMLGQPGTSSLAIDLSALTFIDSSGINALRTAVRDARARGVPAIVAAPSEHVQRVLELVRLGEILPLELSLADAFARLDRDGAGGPEAALPKLDTPSDDSARARTARRPGRG